MVAKPIFSGVAAICSMGDFIAYLGVSQCEFAAKRSTKVVNYYAAIRSIAFFAEVASA